MSSQDTGDKSLYKTFSLQEVETTCWNKRYEVGLILKLRIDLGHTRESVQSPLVSLEF